MSTKNLPSLINLDDSKVIETIKRTVAQGVDDIELSMFLELCKSSGLNPFKKEAWCIKAGGRAQIMVGLNGYLKIANSHPQFDGMEIELTNSEKGELISATCKVWRKDRKYPSTGIAFMKEYKKSTPIWSQMPSVMLGKVAKCIAIREAFPLETSGTYAEEEMPPQFSAEAQVIKATASPAAKTLADMEPLPDNFTQDAQGGIEYIYDIDNADPDIKTKAMAVLQHAKARLDGKTGYYLSKTQLKKLERFEIGHTEPVENNLINA